MGAKLFNILPENIRSVSNPDKFVLTSVCFCVSVYILIMQILLLLLYCYVELTRISIHLCIYSSDVFFNHYVYFDVHLNQDHSKARGISSAPLTGNQSSPPQSSEHKLEEPHIYRLLFHPCWGLSLLYLLFIQVAKATYLAPQLGKVVFH